MKKSFSLLIIVAFVFLLSGCWGSNDDIVNIHLSLIQTGQIDIGNLTSSLVGMPIHWSRVKLLSGAFGVIKSDNDCNSHSFYSQYEATYTLYQDKDTCTGDDFLQFSQPSHFIGKFSQLSPVSYNMYNKQECESKGGIYDDSYDQYLPCTIDNAIEEYISIISHHNGLYYIDTQTVGRDWGGCHFRGAARQISDTEIQSISYRSWYDMPCIATVAVKNNHASLRSNDAYACYDFCGNSVGSIWLDDLPRE